MACREGGASTNKTKPSPTLADMLKGVPAPAPPSSIETQLSWRFREGGLWDSRQVVRDFLSLCACQARLLADRAPPINQLCESDEILWRLADAKLLIKPSAALEEYEQS